MTFVNESTKGHSPTTIKPSIKKTSIDKPPSKVINEIKIYKHFGVSSDIPTCVHIALSFCNSEGQIVLATLKEPSNKLLLPATTQPLHEGQLELKHTTLWPHQPSDEFLYIINAHLSKEEQDYEVEMTITSCFCHG